MFSEGREVEHWLKMGLSRKSREHAQDKKGLFISITEVYPEPVKYLR